MNLSVLEKSKLLILKRFISFKKKIVNKFNHLKCQQISLIVDTFYPAIIPITRTVMFMEHYMCYEKHASYTIFTTHHLTSLV